MIHIYIYKEVLKDQSANSDRYLLCRESARGCYDSDLAALTYGSYIIKELEGSFVNERKSAERRRVIVT